MKLTDDQLKHYWARVNVWGQTRLNSALTQLSVATKAPIRNIEEATRADAELAPVVCEYDYEVLENILGAAFNLTNALIDRVATAGGVLLAGVDDLDKGKKKSKAMKAKYGLLSKGCYQHPGQNCIKAIRDAANCYKHQDEWGPNWDHSQGGTAERLRGYGCEPGAHDNMYRVLRYLGYNPAILPFLAHDVDDWATEFRWGIKQLHNGIQHSHKLVAIEPDDAPSTPSGGLSEPPE